MEAVAQGDDDVIAEEHLFDSPISENEAYKMYGRSDVDQWLKEKLIGISHSGKKRCD